jgi:hypothetical protein
MHSVILTFPGHFWQTQLCLQRLVEFYPETDRVTVIADDIDAGPWSQFVDDIRRQVSKHCDRPLEVIATSTLPLLPQCVAGWWRQQLVKLTLDLILPDDHWFVVDGDVIFGSRCDVRGRVPISHRVSADTRWSQMCVKYVRDVLGVGPGYLTLDQQRVVTSAIPFRYLDRTLLRDLRQHVQDRFGRDFVQAHLAWFDDQTIVADIDPPDRWVMSEWELIECYRCHVRAHDPEFVDVGSGYQLDVDISALNTNNIFQHSYKRDTEIGAAWFVEQGQEIDQHTWLRSGAWYDTVEALQRR